MRGIAAAVHGAVAGAIMVDNMASLRPFAAERRAAFID
jgi:hypothetical protein